jgi:hypothetical protein
VDRRAGPPLHPEDGRLLPVQRIIGQLVKEGQKDGTITTREDNLKRGPEVTEGNIGDTVPKTLVDLGLTRRQSSTFKMIANIPEEKFEATLLQGKSEAAATGTREDRTGEENTCAEIRTSERENRRDARQEGRYRKNHNERRSHR